ncbi:MAG: flagellar basal body P-ring formation protein FlgA [Pseudorhodoplanes sp.]|nr:flagellar basal body P-ring formation protein FlgA [Pseudorhodoplanes sp.]
MIRILILALLLAVPAGAAAQTGDAPLAPSLRQNVIVTDELVRIGDLIDNAGPAAQIAVFRAPDLGATGTVAVHRVVDAVRAHDVFAINTYGLKEITVTRASRNIGNTDIQERIASAIAGQYRIGEAKNIGITFDRNVTAISVEPGIVGDLAVTRLSFDPRSGRFDVTLDVPGSHVVRRGTLRFTGVAAEVFETAVLTRQVARGEVLRASDIVIERRPKRELSADSVADPGAVIGMAARAPIRAGQSLRRADLMKPELVARNEPVTLIFQAPGISLTVRGTATEPGTKGDVINVVNTHSKRQIQGVVTGPGEVTVSSGRPRITASLSSESVTGTPRRSAQ